MDIDTDKSGETTPTPNPREGILKNCANNWFVETKKGTLKPDYILIVDSLINIFCPISYNGNLFIYEKKNGIYRLENEDLGTFINEVIEKSEYGGTTTPLIKEVYSRIRMNRKCKVDEYPFDNEYAIGMKNGVLVFDEEGHDFHFEKFSPSFKITHKFEVNWNPDVDPDLFVNEVGKIWVPADVVPELYKPLAAAILQSFPNNMAIKRIWLTLGGSNSGKSTYANFLERCAGRSAVGRLTLHQLCDPANRFDRFSLVGKIINIGEDISANMLKEVALLKATTGSLYHDVEAKGKDRISVKLTHGYLFSANTTPQLSKEALRDDAVFERFELVIFPHLFENDPTWAKKHMRPEILESFMLNVIHTVQKYWNGMPKTRSIDETRDLWLNYNRSSVYAFMLEATTPDECGYIRKDDFRKQLRLWGLDIDLNKDDDSQIFLKRSTPTDDAAISREVFRNSINVKATKVMINGIRVPCYKGISWKSDFIHRKEPDNQSKLDESSLIES